MAQMVQMTKDDKKSVLSLYRVLGELQENGSLVNELLETIAAAKNYNFSAAGIMKLVTEAEELQRQCQKLEFSLVDLFQRVTHPNYHK